MSEVKHIISNTTKSHLRQIQKAMRQNRLVVLVGAGASATCGVPSWSDLIEELKKELDLPENENDFLKIPQLYKNMRKHKEYHERIREILQDGQIQSNVVQNAILNLNPCHIITTNYDNLLEQEMAKTRDRYFVVRRDEDLPYNRGERMLLKMHGDFASDNIVLTEDDYLDYSKNFPLIRSYVMSLFASKLVLFVGFSYSDINLKYILRDVRHSLGDKMQPVYMLASDKLNVHTQTYLDTNYIHVVTISDEEAKAVLDAQHVEYDLKPFDNEQSNTLYHQLMLIEKYSEQSNDFMELVTNYLSEYADQFSSLGSYIEYIFLPEQRRYVTLEYGELHLPKDIRDSIECIMADDEYGKTYRKEHKEDLDKVMLWLNLNGVRNIAETTVDVDKYVEGIIIEEVTHPMRMFYSMDIGKLTDWMEQQKGKSLSYSKEDMIYPYMLCVTGHYNEAYERYKWMADAMLSAKKYVLYFLCMYNIRALYSPVMNEMIGRGSEIWKRINKEFGKVDLSAIISTLPVDGAIKIILTELENGKYLTNQLIDAEKFCNLLREQRNSSERGVMSLNSNINHVLESFDEITDFQINNCIFNIPFGHFKTIHLRIAEGILQSLLTVEGNGRIGNTRLPELYKGLERLFVFHLQPKEFSELLYRVVDNKKLAYDESFKDAIVEMVNNIYNEYKRTKQIDTCVTAKIIGQCLKNIMWLALYTEKPLLLPHIYELIAAYWFGGRFMMEDKLLNKFTYVYSATGADAVLVMNSILHTNMSSAERLQPAIANLCYYINQDNLHIDELISVRQLEQSENIAYISSFCPGADERVKDEIITCLRGKVKCLYQLIEAEHFSGERIITKELLIKFKDILKIGHINNIYPEEHVCANFAHMVSMSKYEDLKEAIEEIMTDHKCYSFFKDPLHFEGNLDEVPGQWYYYLSDEGFVEMVKKPEVRHTIKEFCDNNPWADDLREKLWKYI